MNPKLALALVTGCVLRYLVSRAWPWSPDTCAWIGVTTPGNSFERLLDGAHWLSTAQTPYATATFHGSPLLLALFQPLLTQVPSAIPILFIISDCFLAYGLASLATWCHAKHSPESTSQSAAGRYWSLAIAAGILFNPFALISYLARSLSVFSHLAVVAATLAAAHHKPLVCTLALAIATHLDPYTVLLYVPMFVLLQHNRVVFSKRVAVFHFLGVVAWSVFLGIAAVAVSRDPWFWWHQLQLLVAVPELAPAPSLAWYFFTQLFDRFQVFFLVLFQLHLLIYVAPLTIAFR
jgi:phosphatidylinositol glycan class U